MRYLVNHTHVESVKEEDGIVYLTMSFRIDKSSDTAGVVEMGFSGSEHHIRLLKNHHKSETVQSLLVAKVFDLTPGKHIDAVATDSKTIRLDFKECE